MSQNRNEQNRGENPSQQGGKSGMTSDDQSGAGQKDMPRQTEQSQGNMSQQGADQVDKDAARSEASRRAQQGVTADQNRGDQQSGRKP